MAQKVMKGALDGFLGTYLSRYSDYDGYWLFGFLVSKPLHLHIDLVSHQIDTSTETPEEVAITLAKLKFHEQVEKAGLSFHHIRAAELEIVREGSTSGGYVYEQEREGYYVLFRATATMDDGRVYGRERSVFVAPHDASVEHCSILGSSLLKAIYNSNLEILDWLIARGIDVNIEHHDGIGPLEIALIHPVPEVVYRLVCAGAKLKKKTEPNYRECLEECIAEISRKNAN
jgi:hypothetical protein